jgi:hypothetical protein
MMMMAAAPAAAASHVLDVLDDEASQLSLSSLSSDLLIRVANYLSVKEICIFDTATASKQLRANFLSALSSDTYIYPTYLDPGAPKRYRYPPGDADSRRISEWQQLHAHWLRMRRVSVNSISLNEQTTAAALRDYETMNKISPGLVLITMHDDVDFPMDMAVARNVETLHRIELTTYGSEQLRRVMASVREWESVGGSLQELVLHDCHFGGEEVDFGNCDSLTFFRTWGCYSSLITTPGATPRATGDCCGVSCTNARI